MTTVKKENGAAKAEEKPNGKKTAKDFVEKVTEKVKEAVKPAPPSPPKAAAPVPKPATAAAKAYDFDLTQPGTLIPLIRDTWNASKGAGDAVYDECAPDFQQILAYRALSAIQTNEQDQSDSALGRFERAIAKHK